jgi:hypothetical protein
MYVCTYIHARGAKMRKRWLYAAAKIEGAWRKEGKLKALYIIDAYGKGTQLNCVAY